MNRIIKLVFVLLLLNCFTFVIDNQGKQKNYFELDVVSAATDGSGTCRGRPGRCTR